MPNGSFHPHERIPGLPLKRYRVYFKVDQYDKDVHTATIQATDELDAWRTFPELQGAPPHGKILKVEEIVEELFENNEVVKPKDKIDLIRGGLYGLAVGDALGATVEFMSREDIKRKYGVHSSMIGGGWLNLAPGEFTDDTQMTIAVARGLAENPADPIPAIGRYFMEWYHSNPPDIGNTTRLGLSLYEKTGDWHKSAILTREQMHGRTAGNGSLMRTLPITFAYPDNPEKMDEISRAVSNMTHPDSEAELSCVFYNRFLWYLGQGMDKVDAYFAAVGIMKDRYNFPGAKKLLDLLENIQEYPEENLRATGYVLDTLACALKQFLEHSSYDEIVIATVNMGDDADTVGAVTGGLAGVYYGFEAISKSWVRKLKGKKLLNNAVKALTGI